MHGYGNGKTSSGISCATANHRQRGPSATLKSRLETGPRISANALKMANLIKRVDEAKAVAREFHDLRQGLEATLAHGKT